VDNKNKIIFKVNAGSGGTVVIKNVVFYFHRNI